MIRIPNRPGRRRRTPFVLVWLCLLLPAAGWLGVRATSQALPRNQALYVTMRDGVKIAIDIWLPTSL